MAKRRLFPVKIDRWDSGFFKKPIVRLTISGRRRYPYFFDSLCGLMSRAKTRGVKHLVIKLKNPNNFYGKDILRLGMKLCGESVDLKLTYKDNMNRNFTTGYDIDLLRSRDIKKMKAIASSAFRRSYFYKCGFGKIDEVDRYHAAWVENLSKDKDVCIFIAKEDNAVTGFLAVKIDKIERYGRIIFIAVHKRHRLKGIGRALMHKCIEWGDGKIGSIFVKTQKDNHNAIILYRKMGFKPVETDKIFCKKISGR